MKHILPKLPYAYNDLEPYIDAQTMEIHHTKHHQTYVDKLNEVLEKYPELAERELADLLQSLQNLPMDDKDKIALQNHGGGHLNHSFFWKILGPQKAIDEPLRDEIIKELGSIEEFKKLFSATAIARFGSGWAWLVRDQKGKLQVYSTANQDSPVMQGHTPLIALDVWEHAYYLKYQNRRQEYVDNWWHVLKLL
jgi:Fe-Mn family superoxide dismutase